MGETILIIDDDEAIGNLEQEVLEGAGYRVLRAYSGTEALLVLQNTRPDLALLDLMLPGLSGEELLPRLQGVSVIVVSAKAGVEHKVALLMDGAADYLTKPFDTGELLARVRVALRLNRYSRTGDAASGGEFQAQGLRINYDRRKVFVEGQEVRLTQTEYNIVAFLSQHAGRVMTSAAIVRAIWGDTDVGSTKKLQVNMANIRKKLGSRPGSNPYILNELGVGYRMIDEDPESRQTAEEGA